MRKQSAGLSVIIFCAGVLFVRCGGGNGTNGTNGIAAKVTDVKVEQIQPSDFVDYVEVTGTVKADVAATISSEEQGVIERWLKEKGEPVRKNEPVVKLKSKVLQANYEEAKANYLLSKATFERQENLYKDNVISEQKFLEYKYTLDRDKARHDNLRARLEKMTVESSVTGVIDDRHAELGEYVQPGTPLFEVVKSDVVKIAAAVPERYIRDLEIGSEVDIIFDILSDQEFTGKITFLGPTISKSSRTFPIEIFLENEEGTLKPEMFADIRIMRAEHDSVVVIPRDAIIETETGKYVFVAEGNVASKREIGIGASAANRAWIREGLEIGEQLIVVGHRDLIDGERIAIHR